MQSRSLPETPEPVSAGRGPGARRGIRPPAPPDPPDPAQELRGQLHVRVDEGVPIPNIPRGTAGYNAQHDCGRGWVVSAIKPSLWLLGDTSKGRAVRQEALTWAVHFVADLHQPLHAIADDRDGDEVLVQFIGRETNLHRLWDGDMIDRVYPDQRMLQD